MQYRLRTLLILLAIGPPILAVGWSAIERYRAWQRAQEWKEVPGPGSVSFFGSINCFFDDIDGQVPDPESDAQPDAP
jgi:hypothetical protein